jgi:predicted nucleic acid-binding protein
MVSRKPRLYVETTIPSYLTSRPSRDVIIAGHQQTTREWWETRRGKFELYISQLVIDEVSAGDSSAASQRIKVLAGVSLLDITPQVGELAAAILTAGKIPRRAATDAAHIAIAAVHAMDFLVTWNCVHMANAMMTRDLVAICSKFGYACPVICTPEELLGELP